MGQLDTFSPISGLLDPASDKSKAGSGLAAHKLQRAYAVIEASLANTIHVRQLADAVNLSPFHFARMFKKSTGHSPHAYITMRRMELAKALLADATLPLGEVARRAGYRTQAHFTDAFRRHVGMTPGRYRRQCVETRVTSVPPPVVPAATSEAQVARV